MTIKKFCPYCMAPIKEGEPCPVCGLTEGSYTPAPHHLPPGTVLMDRYLIGRVLGEGGFGITYIGCDLRLEMKVAIKEYFPTERVTRNSTISLNVSSFTGVSAEAYQKYKDKFLREARTMARMVKQPEIVGVRDYFEANNTAYIVMEYVEGTTMKTLVEQRGGRIPAWELLHMMEPIFGALEVMHASGLIHRDISPENLMLENGNVRLIDFGCARENTTGDDTFTVALKYGYAPIEQYQNKGQGPWTDVYALAATLYFCLTGKRPPQSMDRLVEDELILPRKLGVDLTEKQELALLRGMSIRPRQRFQSMQEFHAALYEGGPINVGGPTDGSRGTDNGGDTDNGGSTGGSNTDNGGNTGSSGGADNGGSTGGSDGANDGENTNNSGSAGLLPWLTAHRTAVGSGIVALAAVVFIAVSLRSATKTPDAAASSIYESAASSVSVSSTAADPEGAAQRRQELDALFANAQTFTGSNDNWEDFQLMLADDSVSAIIIPSGTKLTTFEPTNITKPVLVEEGAYLGAWATLKVDGENACLYIKGECSPTAILRTENGGSIMTDEGSLFGSKGTIWLENKADLEILGGEQTFTENQLLVCSEKAVFSQSTEVSTGEEFLAALDNYEVKAITVTGDVAVDVSGEDLLVVPVPVCINEGASLTLSGTKTRADGGVAGTDDNNAYLDNGAILINYGTLNAYINTAECALVVNYGSWNGGLFNSVSVVLNKGDMTVAGYNTSDGNTSEKNGKFYNEGTVTVESSASNDNSFTFGEGIFYNRGTINVRGENTRIEFSAGITARNMGEICVEDSAWLQSAALLDNYGEIVIDGGELHNSGVLRNNGTVRQPCGRAVNDGVILNETDAVLEFPNRPGGTIETLPAEGADGCTVVRSGEELQSAMGDASVQSIILAQQTDINGDLTVTKPLLLQDTLTIGGTLTVSGGYVVQREDGQMLSAADLVLEQGAFLVQQSSLTAGSVTVGEGAALYSARAEYQRFATSLGDIEINNGGLMRSLSDLALDGVTINIRTGGTLDSHAYLPLTGCTVNIESEGDLELDGGWRFDENTTVTNNGWLYSGGFCQIEKLMAGTLTNNGTIYGYMDVTGVVENNGRLLSDVDQGESTVSIQKNGEIRGNAVEPYTDNGGDWREL